MADRERWKRGQTLTRRRLNRTVEELERGNFVQGGPGSLVSHQGGKTVQEMRQHGALLGHSSITKAVITDIKDDYLMCQFAGSSASVGVGKPFELRRTPFDGFSITYENGDQVSYDYTTNYDSENGRRRDATLGATTEIQEVIPNYWIGDFLMVANVMPVLASGAILDDNGNIVVWEDVNTAARAWLVEE